MLKNKQIHIYTRARTHTHTHPHQDSYSELSVVLLKSLCKEEVQTKPMASEFLCFKHCFMLMFPQRCNSYANFT